MEPASLAENEKLGAVAFVGLAGAVSMVVLGGVVSTIQERVAGVVSTLPAVSMALTPNVCEPSLRLEYAHGDVQAEYRAPSRLHWNVEPASLELKLKLAEVELVTAGGADVIVVSGGAVSTVQAWLAGVASVFPAGSVARTWSEWLPSTRPE